VPTLYSPLSHTHTHTCSLTLLGSGFQASNARCSWVPDLSLCLSYSNSQLTHPYLSSSTTPLSLTELLASTVDSYLDWTKSSQSWSYITTDTSLTRSRVCSPSHVTTDGRSVSQYILVSSPLCDLRPDINSVWKLLSCLCRVPCLTRGPVCLLWVIVSSICPLSNSTEVKLYYDRWSVGQSTLLSGTPATNFFPPAFNYF
jgi:hypothetical protein